MKPYTTLHTLCASLIALLCALFAPPLRAQAQEAYVHQSTDKATLTFFYDTQRSSRDGTTWSINDQKQGYDTMVPAWVGTDGNPNTTTTKAVFDPSFKDFRPTTTASWLQSLLALETVEGLENLNTSQVTNMSRMFYDNVNLKAIDLSHFQTENVTDMSGMFYECRALKELDLSNFNTKNVMDMSKMFAHCESLKSLEIKHFNTEKVKSMERMFKECYALTSLDLSNFNTKKVESMEWMFDQCQALTSLDLSNFNTEEVKSMSFMFNGCESLKKINISNFNTGKVEDMSSMFRFCKSLTSLNLSHFNTEKVKDIYGMFEHCTMLEWVDLTNFQIGDASNTFSMFEDCVNLTTIFCNHAWSGFQDNTFNNCPKLKGAVAYDATKTGTTMANPQTGYFTNKPEAYAHQSEDQKTLTFYYDKLRASRKGHTWSINDQKKEYDTMVPAWTGTVDPYDIPIKKAVFDPSFKDFRPTTTASWLQSLLALETVEGLENLNTSQVTNMSRMFYDNVNLKAIDLSHFQTENVTDMSRMFDRCLELKELDLSNFNTEKVKSMDGMFAVCESLQKINISNFNTKKVTDMSRMFYDCRSLKKINLSNFNTENVEEMDALFSECIALTSLNLSNFNTKKVKRMGGMFYKCRSLTSLNLSNFNTENVKEMDGMFENCTMLEWVDLTNVQMGAASTASYMFADCVNLTTIFCNHSWSSKFDEELFNNCPKLKGAVAYDETQIDATMANPTTGYFTSKLEAYAHQSEDQKTLTFYYDKLRASRKGHTWSINDQKKEYDTMVPAWTGTVDPYDIPIKKAVFDPSFKDFRPTTTASWLQSLLALETVEGLENLNTSQVTNMSRMFYDNVNLKAIDLSHFQTENVTDMSKMFYYCLALKKLDISNFNTKNVTDMSKMFAGCESLKSLKIKHFNTKKVEKMDGLFSECYALTSLDLSNFNTEEVKDVESMFEHCTMLEWVDLTNVQMGAASNTYHMFTDCVNLTTIFCDHSWSSISADLFNNCPKLKGAVAYDATKTGTTMANPQTGYFTNKPEAYAHQSEDQKTLTFYYDNLRASRKGRTWGINETKVMQNLSVPAWAGTWEVANETTTKVVFDASFQEVRPTTTAYWFLHYKALTDIQGLEHLNTSQVTDMTAMFSRCLALSTLDLASFNTKQVTNMSLMFNECTALKQLNLSGFNTENVTNMMYLFNECAALEKIDLTHFNTSSVTNMYGLFDGCKSLTTLDLKSFNTSEVNNMGRMFSGCQALTQLDLQNFNTANVTYMSYMFSGCAALESLDLSHFNTTNVVEMTRMFSESKKLAHIQCLDSWQCPRSAQMFEGCLKLKGAVDYDNSKTDVTMANPETGYFSKYPTAIDRNFLKAHKAQGIYTLQGKRVNGSLQHLPAGVYIVNGKKVVVGVRR